MKPELFQQGAKNKANIQRGHQQKHVLFLSRPACKRQPIINSPKAKSKIKPSSNDATRSRIDCLVAKHVEAVV